MDAASLACAPSGARWQGINWAHVHRQVRRLQTRIVKALVNRVPQGAFVEA